MLYREASKNLSRQDLLGLCAQSIPLGHTPFDQLHFHLAVHCPVSLNTNSSPVSWVFILKFLASGRTVVQCISQDFPFMTLSLAMSLHGMQSMDHAFFSYVHSTTFCISNALNMDECWLSEIPKE